MDHQPLPMEAAAASPAVEVEAAAAAPVAPAAAALAASNAATVRAQTIATRLRQAEAALRGLEKTQKRGRPSAHVTSEKNRLTGEIACYKQGRLLGEPDPNFRPRPPTAQERLRIDTVPEKSRDATQAPPQHMLLVTTRAPPMDPPTTTRTLAERPWMTTRLRLCTTPAPTGNAST